MPFDSKTLARKRFTTRLSLEALEARDVPAVLLPDGFAVGGGLYDSGDLIAGVFADKPAYLTVSGTVVSPITVLPSLSVAAVGQFGNPEGQVQDIVRLVNGEVRLVGWSFSQDSNILNAFGTATTWNITADTPTGYCGALSGYNSIFIAGNSQGIYVGESVNGGAVCSQGAGLVILPNNGDGSTYAQGISESNNCIIGSVGYNAVYWAKNAVGTYDLKSLQGPTFGEPVGDAWAVAGNLAAGRYFDPSAEGYVGVIWNLDTGRIAQSFPEYGGVDVEVSMIRIGSETITVFSSTEGNNAFANVRDAVTGANRTFSLNTTLGISVGVNVRDLFERPGGGLGLAYLGPDGHFYVEDLAVNDLGKLWGGASGAQSLPTRLPAGFSATSGVAGPTGDIVGGVFNNKPAYVVNGIVTVLPSLSVQEIGPLTGNPEGQIQEIVRLTNGEVRLIGYSRSEDSDVLNGF